MKNNKQNYCLNGVSVKNFWSKKNLCSQVELRFDSGCDADVTTSFQSVTKPYKLISNVKSGINGTSNSFILEKALIILSLPNISGNFCDVSVGYNETISMDKEGGFRGGWINCDPRNYYGYGFEGFINPFIFNKSGVGISIDYNSKGLTCFTGIKNIKNYASTINNSTWTQGFLSSDTPSECYIGICYKNETKLPIGLMFVCTQNDIGKLNSNPILAAIEIASILVTSNNKAAITTKALSAGIQSFTKDKKLLSYTATGSTELLPGTQLNCALSCANLKGGTNGEGRIVKWSAGCITYRQTLNDKFETLTYGLHIGTPAYLQEDYNTLIKKNEKIPLVCEINCLINFCGINIPVYLDFMNNHDSSNGQNIGSVCILGLRPMEFWGFGCGLNNKARCISSNIINCTEGGLHEDD